MARTPTANASSGRSTFKTVLKAIAYGALVGLLALGVLPLISNIPPLIEISGPDAVIIHPIPSSILQRE